VSAPQQAAEGLRTLDTDLDNGYTHEARADPRAAPPRGHRSRLVVDAAVGRMSLGWRADFCDALTRQETLPSI
jgi:hypothetical protein